MFKEEPRCPCCKRLIGIAQSNEETIAKVSLVAPKIKSTKRGIFESRCPKCKNIIYILMMFID